MNPSKVHEVKKETKAARDFGKRVRVLRMAKGWSQERLALEAGISPTYMGEIERGECNVSIFNIARIADALSVPIADLFINPRG
jgi:transcriptional regulator with XRE-family HTH domain